jgi:hypothetical protein
MGRSYEHTSNVKWDYNVKLANEMFSFGHIRHIPVVEYEKLLGVVSEHDLMGPATSQICGLSTSKEDL